MYKRKRNKALNLTPLIDVMTTLIIFILIQSSDSPVEVEDQIKLAKSEYGESVKNNTKLTVGMEEINLGDDYKISIVEGEIPERYSHKSEKKLIEDLYNHIAQLKESKKESKDDKVGINLSFDKRVSADSVKKIIYTLTVAGVDDIYYIGEKE